MKSSLLITLALFFALLTAAQSTEQCGTMSVWEQQVQDNPQLKQNLDRIERQIQQRLSQRSAMDSSVIVIPVVFHIVHNGEPVGTGPNISDAQVLSQLEVLNEDFRRLNADTVNTPNVFKPVAADTKIEFCLATQAPNGAVSSGINRVNGGRANWSTGDIQSTLKPSTVWDADKYLNFWVVNFSSSSLLGYAQFPGGNKQTDGVVVGYRFVGRSPHNPFSGNYNGGRTGTHEVGHWLNLRHVWGDGPCAQDDFVDDTPLSDASNSGCPSTNSCTDTPIDHPDMVENYMDYTHDDCMNIFTQGQTDRMRAAIQAARPQLLQQPLACTPLPTFKYTGRVVDSLTGQGIAGAQIAMDGFFNYTATTDTGGYFELPNFFGDTYSYFVGKWGYITKGANAQAFDTTSAPLLVELSPGYYDDFALDFNWEESGTASTGRFTRGEPVGTDFNGTLMNPGVDINIDLGQQCLMTGNGGGNAGTDDVDDGTTQIVSPYFDASTFTDPLLSFYRWFANAGGSGTPDDELVFMIDNNQRVDTLKVVNVNDPSLSQWVYEEFRLAQFTTPTDSMRFMVSTADQPFSGHLVEGAIDYFRLSDSAKLIQAPIADFTQDKDTVCAGSTVQYFNASQNAATSFLWTFEGGQPTVSTAENPIVQYDSAGTYDVVFKAINAGGEDSIIRVDQIFVAVGPDFTVSANDATCFALQDGQAEVTVNSGTPPFTYNWSSGDTGNPVTGLSIGFYFVTVTAGNGCTAERFFEIDQPVRISTNTSFTADTNNLGLGTATVTVQGGVKPYTYLWDDPQGQTDRRAINLTAGTYQVEITDANGCIEGATVEVPNVVLSGVHQWEGDLAVFPNPATSFVQVQWDLAESQPITIQLVNATGQLVYQQEVNAVQWQGRLDVQSLPMGNYWLRLQGERVHHTQSIIILR